MTRDHRQCLSHPNWIKQKEEHIKYMNEQKQKRVGIYNENPKLCKHCNNAIMYEKRINKFCSSSCSATYHMSKKKLVQFCIFCNKQITNNKYGQRRKFCNHKCHREHDYYSYIDLWKRGKESGLSGYSVSNHIRKYMFKKYNNKCCKCGWCEINIKSKKIPLQINHIDGNYKNCVEENFELLCPNCHSLTVNFGALNMGKGRNKRRQRYAEEKTS